MEKTFSIRPATADDIEALVAIEKVCHPIPWNHKQFESELQNSRTNFLVYTDDETDSVVAGYIVFWDLGDDIHILNVTVSLDWRGLGMGQKLVHYAINHAYRNHRKRVILEVRTSNTAAIKLYEKLGFKTEATRKRFYSDGADAHFMTLSVNSIEDEGEINESSSDKSSETVH